MFKQRLKRYFTHIVHGFIDLLGIVNGDGGVTSCIKSIIISGV